MIRIETGEVLRIIEERAGILDLVVQVGNKEERAIQYTGLSAPVVPGQTVHLNTTAVRLGLGTGGYHFVLPNKSVSGCGTECEEESHHGHIMKLRYTPGQVRVLSCEEPDHPAHDVLDDKDSIEGMIVIAAELHSLLPAIAATISFASSELQAPRVAYVMTDGAALPIAFSRTVAELKEKGIICGTVTVGHAFGGDLEAVNLYSGILAARYILKADITIVTMGPGIVGTGTRFGHTGIEQGQIINAIASLGGTPIACPRISFVDSRQRHQGVSHHTLTALGKVALAEASIPIPILEPAYMEMIIRQLREYEISSKHRLCFHDGSLVNQAAAYYELKLATMGRTLVQEQPFFMAAGAAGKLAIELLRSFDMNATGAFGAVDDIAIPDTLAT